MSQGEMMTPLERMGFKRQSVAAAAVGAVNTAVVLFAGAVIASNPVTPRTVANFCTILDDANAGTTFKFVRKGLYHIEFIAPLTAADTNPSGWSIGLDAPAAQFLAATHTPANLAIFEDFARALQVAATQQTVKLTAEFFITDLLAGTTLAANGTANGTVRVHASSGAGAQIAATATVDAEVGLVCWLSNETFG